MSRARLVTGLWWAAALAAVALLAATELFRPLAPAAPPIDLADAGVSETVLAQARAYRSGLRPIVLASVAARLAVVAMALSGPVRRRVTGRVRLWTDRRAAAGRRALRPLVAAVLGVGVWAASDVARLPLQVLAQRRSVAAGLSTQTVGEWLGDMAIVLAPTWLAVAAAVAWVTWLVGRRPRDWAPVAGVTLGLAGVGLVVVSPLVFEPLLLDFEPLEDGALRPQVVALADEALGAVPGEVLVADASRRTTASNAYVSGVGGTRRVVLYDTLLRDAPTEEVLAIVAHELAHRANRDVERTAATALGGTVAVVLVLAALLRGRLRDPDGRPEPATAVPAVATVLLGMVLLLPVASWSSRRAEAAADQVALALTGDPATFAAMMAGLAERNLADPDPPAWEVWLRYSHPPIGERIGRASLLD